MAAQAKKPPEPVKADNVAGALRALANKAFLEGVKYSEQQMRARREGAHPDILLFERAFVRKLAKLDVPVFAHSIVRTITEQNGLYVRGVSRARGRSGPHTHGVAVDLIHSTKAWDGMSPDEWLMFGHLGKEVAKGLGISIMWGGDWRNKPSDPVGWDPAHWELNPWRTAWDRHKAKMAKKEAQA